MTCYEDTEDDKNENGDGENKLESKNTEDYERKVGPGTARNTEEPQGTPPMQLYVFMTGIMNEWAMSTIEDNSATPRVPSSVRSWMESSKYGEDEKSRNMVRAYNNFMRDYPWMTDGLMQDNCRFGDMLKDEKRKSQFKYELGRLMGEYTVPLPLGNFSWNNKETRRLELWKNRRGMWFDHVEHMEEGPEQNKEWEKFWGTVDEDMFTYM